MTQICLSIIGPTFPKANDQINRALSCADLIELRLDLWQPFNLEEFKIWSRGLPLPAIFTVRSSAEGGRFWGSDEERVALLKELLALEPAYIDIELSHLPLFADCQRGSTQVIGSLHTRGELPTASIPGVDLWKLVIESDRVAPLFDLYDWVDRHPDRKVIPLCMGKQGPLSRLLAPLMGSPFVHASLDGAHAVAAGQLPADELRKFYHYGQLTPSTRLMGVIGGPQVAKSLGRFVHNQLLVRHGIDAVYLPIPIEADECALFLERCRRFNPIGFSVTMPHKERIAALIGAEGVGAINTLRLSHGEFEGCNTDGIGALAAIEAYRPVRGQKLAMIGAGGAARAIAAEAKRRGAEVCLYNRTEERAQRVAQELGVDWAPLSELASAPYEILVQATSVGMEGGQPIPSAWIREGCLLLEIITHPAETPLMIAARERGAKVIGGKEMYIHQAVAQVSYWHGVEEGVEEEIRELLSCP